MKNYKKVIITIICICIGIGVYFSICRNKNNINIDNIKYENLSNTSKSNYKEIDNKLYYEKEDNNDTKDKSNVYERNYKIIGNNLYYDNELIEEKGREEKDILNKYKIISEYFNKQYTNINIYISNLNYGIEDGEITFNAYQIINRVIIRDVHFTIYMKDNEIRDIYFVDTSEFFYENIETENLISIEEIKKKALNLANENVDKIFASYERNKEIKGEYYLEYNIEDNLYYNFILNNYSTIKIDAITGDILYSYFFNGIYY